MTIACTKKYSHYLKPINLNKLQLTIILMSHNNFYFFFNTRNLSTPKEMGEGSCLNAAGETRTPVAREFGGVSQQILKGAIVKAIFATVKLLI